MKIQILRCERFDDCTSLIDRLKWVKVGRVLIVMPDKNPSMLSRQDFARLKRKATALHADLALVSRDNGLRKTALSAGVAAFTTSEEARQADWARVLPDSFLFGRRLESAERLRAFRRTEAKQLPTWARWLFFGLAVLAMLALIIVILPGANVDLNLPREWQSGELIVTASIDHPVPDLIAIPLYEITLKVSATIYQKTSGTVRVGDTPATGAVIFTNLTDQVQVIAVGVVVRALEPACRYSVKQGGNLPAGPGTSVSLAVEEMDGRGMGCNLPPSAIIALDPPLGYSVSVTNPQALNGGTQKVTSALAQADLLSGEIAIDQALGQAFLDQIGTSLPEGGTLIRNSILVEETLTESTPPPYDLPNDSFEVSKTAELTGLYYLKSDLEKWAALALDTSLSDSRIAVPGSLEIEILSIHYSSRNAAHITLLATRQTIPVFDPQGIANSIHGLKPESASWLIEEQLFPGSQPEIRLTPAWWGWLPFAPLRISIHG